MVGEGVEPEDERVGILRVVERPVARLLERLLARGLARVRELVVERVAVRALDRVPERVAERLAVWVRVRELGDSDRGVRPARLGLVAVRAADDMTDIDCSFSRLFIVSRRLYFW